MMMMKMKMKAKEYFGKLTKDRGGKEILVELGLAVVAVALLAVFQTSLKSAITTIASTLQTTINDLFKA